MEDKILNLISLLRRMGLFDWFYKFLAQFDKDRTTYKSGIFWKSDPHINSESWEVIYDTLKDLVKEFKTIKNIT